MIAFQVQVNAGVAAGTLISNQALVDTRRAARPADRRRRQSGDRPRADGGRGRQRAAAHDHEAGRGGRRRRRRSPARTLEYVVRVANIAAVPASSVVIRDDLEAATPGTLTYVAGSATLNGLATGVTVVGSLITADYSTTVRPAARRARRSSCASAPRSTRRSRWARVVTNTGVVYWNNPHADRERQRLDRRWAACRASAC